MYPCFWADSSALMGGEWNRLFDLQGLDAGVLIDTAGFGDAGVLISAADFGDAGVFMTPQVLVTDSERFMTWCKFMSYLGGGLVSHFILFG